MIPNNTNKSHFTLNCPEDDMTNFKTIKNAIKTCVGTIVIAKIKQIAITCCIPSLFILTNK
jgi:hypothetical protein